jgi:hypothetical protein
MAFSALQEFILTRVFLERANKKPLVAAKAEPLEEAPDH